MNTTVLALQEEQVLVAVGKSGAQPSVQALYSAPAHGGGMENWEKAIGALWQQHRLPTRGITLVLPDEAVATKTITAPSMPENKLEELVRHEMRPREDQLAAADYVPLGTDAEGRQQLFCAACRKETMEEYLAMTDRLGLRLQSVTVTMAGRLKLLHAMQFHTASRSGGTLTDVYYAGCSDDDFEVCLAGIRGLGLKVSRLPECRAFRALPNGERLDDWLGCAETLIRTVLRANKELDLLRSYRRLSRGSKGQTGLLHSFYTPIAVCLVVCAAVWCVFLQMNSSLSHRTDDINDWLNDPTVIEQYNEAAEKQQRNDNLVQGLQQVRNLTDALATYPQVDSALMSKIGAAGGAQVSMVLTGYDAATGALQFDAQSGSVIDIPSYVLKLQKTGLFCKVDYTGYTYEDGVYVLSLNCILLGEEAAE